MRVRRTAILAGAVVLALPAGSTAEPARTLAVVPGGVLGIAQDGGRVAWLDCRGLSIARLDRRLRVRARPACAASYGDLGRRSGPGTRLALGGTRALWTQGVGGNNWEVVVQTQALGERGVRRLAFAIQGAGGGGTLLGPVAGDGRTLVYSSVATIPIVDAGEPFLSGRGLLAGGATWVVRGRVARLLPGAPGGVALAASGDLVAVAPPGTKTALPGVGNVGPCACDAAPDWSPDGQRLAFASARSVPGAGIWVAGLDGRDVRRLTSGPLDYAPDWSPDGSRIVFQRSTSGFELGEAWLVDADGRNERRLVPGDATRPVWSPDGTLIAFSRIPPLGEGGIWVVRPDGTGLRRVAGPWPGVYSWPTSPTWSPDGESIAYLRPDGHVYTTPLAGGPEARLTDIVRPRADLEWAPDGRGFVYAGETGLVRLEPDGPFGAYEQPLGTFGGRSPSFSPDGSTVAFDRAVGGERDLGRRALYALPYDDPGTPGPAPGQNPRERSLSPRYVPPAMPVEVRRIRSGALVGSFEPTGDVQAVALGGVRAAALVRRAGGGFALEVYGLPRGPLVRRVAVRDPGALQLGRHAPALSISGRRVLYADGRSLRVLDVRTGRIRTVATVRRPLVGASLEGRRIVWAENVRTRFGRGGTVYGYGRIRTALAPAVP